MNIVVITASTNQRSNSAFLADRFIEGIGDAEITRMDLASMPLKQFDLGHYEGSNEEEQEFASLREKIVSADGLVIATPVWNFGVPGQLKNLIDRMGSFGLDETHSKGTLKGLPFYLIFTGGAPEPAWAAIMEKSTSFVPKGLEYFGGSHIGTHFEGRCTAGRGVFDLVVDTREESIEKVRAKGAEFAKIVQTFAETGEPPLKHKAKSGVMRIGERILKTVFR